jgi:hypothetical protein
LTNDPGRIFEIEAASVEEFLRLLEEREEGESSARENPDTLSRAVFVARMLDQRGSRFGYPSVTRQVVAAFVHGRGVVYLRTTASHTVELPENARITEVRHREAYEELREGIQRGLEEADLSVPLYEGYLRRTVAPEAGGGAPGQDGR